MMCCLRRKYKYFPGLYAVLFSIFYGINALASIVPDPKERVEYWRQNYTELNAAQHKRVARAQEIFDRVLNAAGSRHGVHPRLLVIAEDPLNITLPISIPDGWVVASKSVLDLCYKSSRQGDDKLAFVLAHEIAHLLDDDFWHINFFNAIDLSQSMSDDKGQVDHSVIEQLKGIVNQADKVAAKELRADEKGILFTSMAGFNVSSIIDQKSGQSFFKQWEALLNIKRVKHQSVLFSGDANKTHPTSEQRAAAILARLQQVSSQAELFNLGLMFYQSGNFESAITAFSEFRRHYPGREVHHNLAVSHHQLALTYLADLEGGTLMPFKLPLTIDPITRAGGKVFRGPKEDKERFKENINTAIEYYQAAINQDPDYLLAYKNLGSAYVTNNEPFKAIALLKDALELSINDAELYNILGVAFYFTDNVEKARENLQKSINKNKKYIDPLYNYGKIEFLENNLQAAKGYWSNYLKADEQSNWAMLLRSKYGIGKPVPRKRGLTKIQNEMLGGLQVGNYTEEVPEKWGLPKSDSIPLQEARHATFLYGNGIKAITEGDEIRVLSANGKFSGQSGKGVKIGDKQGSVIRSYGLPALSLATTQGNSLVYLDQGITFQLRGGKVVSWIIY